MVQLVDNPPAMQETCFLCLDLKDFLEKGKLSTSVFWLGEFWPAAIPYFTQKNNLEGARFSDKQIQINLEINGAAIR